LSVKCSGPKDTRNSQQRFALQYSAVISASPASSLSPVEVLHSSLQCAFANETLS
jgi:hypothetical protein